MKKNHTKHQYIMRHNSMKRFLALIFFAFFVLSFSNQAHAQFWKKWFGDNNSKDLTLFVDDGDIGDDTTFICNSTGALQGGKSGDPFSYWPTNPDSVWTGPDADLLSDVFSNVTIFSLPDTGYYHVTLNAYTGGGVLVSKPHVIAYLGGTISFDSVLPSDNVCEGTIVTLTAKGDADTYAWYRKDADTWSLPYDKEFDTESNSISDTLNIPGSYTYRVYGYVGPCETIPQFIDTVITVDEAPTTNAGGPYEICGNERVTLAGSIGGAAIPNQCSWSSSGDGTFVDGSDNPDTDFPDAVEYIPGSNDITNGEVYLTLTTNSSGSCSAATDTDTATVHAQPTATISANANPTCEGNTLELTGNAGMASWDWTLPDASTANGQVLTIDPVDLSHDGIYELIVTDNNGCSDTTILDVEITPAIDNNTITSPASPATYCVTDPVTTIDIDATTPTGGSGTYEYDWQSSTDGINFASTSVTSEDYIGLSFPSDGTFYYRRVVTSTGTDCNTSISDTLQVTVVPAVSNNTIDLNGETTDTVCQATDPGVITGTSPTGGGGAPYNYTWQQSTTSPTSGFADIGGAASQDYDVPGLAQTTWFRRLVQGDASCDKDTSNVVEIIVNDPITNNTINDVANNPICNGEAPGLFDATTPTGGNGTYSYEWELSTDQVAWTSIPSSDIENLDYTSALTQTTWFRRLVTSPPCPAVTSNEFQVVVNELPEATISGDTSVCQNTTYNATITVDFTAGTAPYDIVVGVSTGGQLNFNNINDDPFTFTVNPASTTIYTITSISDANGCSGSGNGSATVTVYPAPSASASLVANPVCEGDDIDLHAEPSGMATYEWSHDTDPYTATVGVQGHTIPNAAAKYEGWFQVIVTDGSGCSDTAQTASLVVTDTAEAPTTIVASAGTNVCPGDNFDLTVTDGDLGEDADWFWYSESCGGTFIQSGTNTINLTLNTPGVYDYYVRAEGSCNTTECAHIQIQVDTLSTDPVALNTRYGDICAGATDTLTVDGGSLGTGGEWVLYKGGCAGVEIDRNTTGVFTVSPAVTTDYFVRAEDNCGNTACVSATVNVIPPPTPPTAASANPDEFCIGSVSDVDLSATGGTGDSLAWFTGSCGGTLVGTVANGNVLTLSGADIPTTTTTYYARTESETCPSSSCADVTIVVNPLPEATINTTGPALICEGDTTQITVNFTVGIQPFDVSIRDNNSAFDTTITNITAGSITLDVNPLVDAEYVVYNLSDGNGCNNTAIFGPAIVDVNALPGVVASNTGPACEGFDSVTLNSLPNGMASYYWEGPNGFESYSQDTTLNNVSLADTGYYKVTVSDAAGCTNSDSTFLDINEKPTALAGQNQAMCWLGQGDDSLILGNGTPPAVGGHAPYSITWNSSYFPSGTSSENNPKVYWEVPPNYSFDFELIVTDSNGCSDRDTTSVITASILEANAGDAQYLCHPNNGNDSIQLGGLPPDDPTAVGDSPPYYGTWTYQWTSIPTDPSISSDTVANPFVLPNETVQYTVTIIDSNGCYEENTVEIAINDEIFVDAGSADTMYVCFNESIILGGSPTSSDPTAYGGSGIFEYRWYVYNEAGDDSVIFSLDEHPVVLPPDTTKYMVKVTDDDPSVPNCQEMDYVVVIPNAEIFVDVGPPSVDICNGANGGSVLIGDASVGGGTPGYSYQWTTDVSYAWEPGQDTLPEVFVSPLQTTMFTLTVTDGTGTCTAEDSILVNVNDSVVAQAADTGIDTLYSCHPNNSTDSVQLGGSPAVMGGDGSYTYEWIASPAYSWALGQDELANPNVRPAVTTTFTLVGTDGQGCTDTSSVVVEPNQEFIISANRLFTGTICPGINGGDDTISVSFDSGGIMPIDSLAWTASPATPGFPTSDTIIGVNPDDSTTYTVVAIDGAGCFDTSAITVNVYPVISSDVPFTDSTTCSYDSVQLSVTPINFQDAANATYAWTEVPDLGTLSDPNIQNPTVLPPVGSSITYYVTLTDTTDCTTMDSIMISASQSVDVDIADDTAFACHSNNVSGEGVHLGETLSVSGGVPFTGPSYNYSWEESGTANTLAGQETLENPEVFPDTTTFYYLTVTDSLGCQGSDTIVVEVAEEFIILASADDTICTAYNSGSFTLDYDTISGGFAPYDSLVWTSNPPGFTSYDPNPVVQPASATTYYIFIRDDNGCIVQDTTSLELYPEMQVNILPDVTDTTICHGNNNGGSLQLFAEHDSTEAPFNYLWYSPDDPTLNTTIQDPLGQPQDSTYYTVTVTDNNGCYQSDSIVVNVLGEITSIPQPPGWGDTIYSCNMQNQDTLIQLGGDPPYTYGLGSAKTLEFHWTSSPAGFESFEQRPFVSPDTSTWYHLTVTDTITGCGHTDSVFVKLYDQLYATAHTSGDTNICYGDSIQLGGSPTAIGGASSVYSYEWYIEGNPAVYSTDSNPYTTPLITTTNYVVFVQDSVGCYDYDTTSINVAPQLFADAGPTDTNLCLGSDSIQIGGSPTASGGLPFSGSFEYIYDWTPIPAKLHKPDSVANPLVYPDTTVLYQLTVMDSIGCIGTDDIFVEVHDTFALDFGETSDTICQGDVLAWNADTLVTMGGTTPFVYEWVKNGNPDGNTQFYTDAPVADALYKLSITDQNYCQATDSIDITVNSTLYAVIDSIVTPDSCGGFSGAVYAHSEGGGDISEHQYSWYLGTPPFSGLPISNNDSLFNISSGVYTLVVDDGYCNDTVTVSIDDPFPPQFALTGDPAICEGEEYTLTAVGSENVSYLFVLNNDTIQNWSTNDFITTDTLAPPAAYFIVYADSAGCFNVEDTTIAVNPLPVANLQPTDTVLCFGDSVELSTPPGLNYSYDWGSLPIDPNLSQDVPSQWVSPSTTTLYNVKVRDFSTPLGCATQSDTVIVDIHDRPVVDFGTPFSAIGLCDGETDTIGVAPVAGYSYQWYSSPAYPGLDTNASTQVINPIEDTWFYQVVTDTTDIYQCSAIDSLFVNVSTTPYFTMNEDTTVCQGQPVQIGLTAPDTLDYYYWYSDPSYTIADSTQQIIWVNPSETIDYILQAHNGMPPASCYDQDTVHIDVIPVPNVNFGTSEDTLSICEGDTVHIGAPPLVDHIYLWSSTPSYTGLVPGASGQDVAPMTDTWFTLTVDDTTTDGCPGIDSIFIEVNEIPFAYAGNDSTICQGDSIQIGPVDIIPVPGYTYQWTSVPKDPLLNVTAPIQWVTPTSTIDTIHYILDVFNGGCTSTDTIEVVVDHIPEPYLIASSDTICEGSGVTLTTIDSLIYTYDWSSNPFYPPLQDDVFTQTVTPTTTTNFYVTLDDTLNGVGCTATDSAQIFVNSLPNADAGAVPEPICRGDNVFVGTNITPPSDYVYYWSSDPNPGGLYPNDPGIWVNPSQTTTYYLNVVDTIPQSLMCENFDTVIVDVFQPIENPIGLEDSTVCYGTSLTFGPDQGSNFNWRFATQEDTILSNLQNPTYLFTDTTNVRLSYIDSNGCDYNSNVIIDIYPSMIHFAEDTTEICEGDMITLLADFTAMGDYDIWWERQGNILSEDSLLTVSPEYINTQYSFYMVDSVCDLEKSKYLHIDIPVVYAGEDTTVCSGSIVSIGNTQSDTANFFHWKWNGNTSETILYNEFPYYVLPYDTTIYILEATSLNNCKSRDTITINTLPLPEISVQTDAKKYSEDYLTIYKDYNPLIDTVINDSIMYDIYEIIKGQTVEISVIPDTNYEYSFYKILNSQDEQNADTSMIYSGANPTVETFVPPNISSADIDIYVEDQNGCISQEYLSLLALANLPNAFTPLTKDGKNDLFLKGVPVKILNRWGQTMYEGSEGWDGTFNGRDVSPGTYFYIVEIKDGERTYTMKGTVLVVEQ